MVDSVELNWITRHNTPGKLSKRTRHQYNMWIYSILNDEKGISMKKVTFIWWLFMTFEQRFSSSFTVFFGNFQQILYSLLIFK